MAFRGIICGNAFYATNNVGIAHFSLFVINANKENDAFIHKIKVFSKIFLGKLSDIPLIL